jgi:hypothetical protein
MKTRVWYDAGIEAYYVEFRDVWWCRVKDHGGYITHDKAFRTLDAAKAHIAEMKEDRRIEAERKKRRKELSKVVYEETI